MVVDTHLDPSMEIYQNTQISYSINIRARGVIPRQITLMSPLFHMGRSGPNDSTIVMFGPMASWPTSNTLDECQT